MTGLLHCGVMIWRGVTWMFSTSARVSMLCGTCRFISSPSKSALYGDVQLRFMRNVDHGSTWRRRWRHVVYGPMNRERGPSTYLDAVAHHGHFVQRRLAVEDDEVSVADVPLDLVAALQVQVRRLRVEAQIDAVAVLADDVPVV